MEPTNTDRDESPPLWYVRSGLGVRGPFKEEIIARFVRSEHLDRTHELSCDRTTWRPITELYPMAAPAPHRRHSDESLALRAVDVDRGIGGQPSRFRQGFSVAMLFGALLVIGLGLTHQGEAVAINCTADAAPSVNYTQCALEGRRFDGADLRTATLRSAALSGTSFLGAKLGGADLAFATLRGSDLSHADLAAVSAVGADLQKADLRFADLRHADLSHADLRGADLKGADLTATRFDHALWGRGLRCLPDSIGACSLPEGAQRQITDLKTDS
ncbi:MAG: pentapeptide repeat-containing protein [Pseudomonadota bacterium]